MRISNWCVLFMALFLGSILLPDFKETYERNAQYTMELYHRNIDRATEDALVDQVREEYEDGNILIDKTKVTAAFFEQICLDFDLITESEKETVAELFLLQELVNQKEEMTEEERNRIAEEMEQLLHQNSKLQQLAYCMLFPANEGEGWSNPIDKKSFYTFFEQDDAGTYQWTDLLKGEEVRYTFSGAKIRKMIEKK